MVDPELSETCGRPWAPSQGQQKQHRISRRGWTCRVCSSGEDRHTCAAGEAAGQTSGLAQPSQGKSRSTGSSPKGKQKHHGISEMEAARAGVQFFSLLHRDFEGSLSHRKLAVGDLGFGTLAHSVNNSTLRIFSLPGTCVYPLLRRSQRQTKAHPGGIQ